MTCNLVRVIKVSSSGLVTSVREDNTDYWFNLENKLRIELFDSSIFGFSPTKFTNFQSLDKFEVLAKYFFKD